MTQYKYFSHNIRVKIANDETKETTISAVFQERFLWIFWKFVGEIDFDLYDYSEEQEGFERYHHLGEQKTLTPYCMVTITFTANKCREIWMTGYFTLEDSLQKHSQKYV